SHAPTLPRTVIARQCCPDDVAPRRARHSDHGTLHAQAPYPGVMTSSRTAWGHGLTTTTSVGTVLDTWFPAPALGARTADDPALLADLEALAGPDADRDVVREVVTREIDLDAPPADAVDAYLRLHLLSHRLV